MDQAFSFRLLGYPVSVGWGAVLVLGLIGLNSASSQVNAMGLLIAVGTALTVAASILVHELGHALAADRFGLGTRLIRLHGLGGDCSYSGWPTARQQVRVSLAGPGAGLVLGAISFAVQWTVGDRLPWLASYLLHTLVWINVVWSLFNLLPMVPLDGSSALDATLRQRLPRNRTDNWMRMISMGTAIVVGLGALMLHERIVVAICLASLWQSWTGRRII